MPSFYIETLGCVKNQVDSDVITAQLIDSGMKQSDDPADSDVILVNTCAFLTSAINESLDEIFSLAEAKKENALLIACGCFPARYQENIIADLPEVDVFVSPAEYSNIVDIISDKLGSYHASKYRASTVSRTLGTSYAFVKIAEGCNRLCSFCAIPYIRGPLYSRPLNEIIDEVEVLAKGGCKEIVFVAQDPLSWGKDLDEQTSIRDLLIAVNKTAVRYGLWVRLLYLFPDDLDEQLIDTMVEAQSILPYFDIPLQHVSADILKRMGRKGSKERYRKLIAYIRQAAPNAAIRTTALVGFPGETEKDLEELEDFLREIEPDYLAVFAYSCEEGTRAAKLPDQIEQTELLKREQRFVTLSEELGFQAAQKRVGSCTEAIIDCPEDNSDKLIAHAWFQAPDTDGIIYLPKGSGDSREHITAKLDGCVCYDYFGERVDDDLV